MEWLKAILKSIGFLTTTFLAEEREKKKAKRLEVPDNIWERETRRAEALKPGPRNGYAEFEPEDDGNGDHNR
jgi:hypothetical protein